MSESSNSFSQYYKTGNYKGFYKIREQVFKLSAQTTMTFSNGEKEFFASGEFKEEALQNIFSQIDNFLNDEKSSKLKSENTGY